MIANAVGIEVEIERENRDRERDGDVIVNALNFRGFL